jgi:hypothetical protein
MFGLIEVLCALGFGVFIYYSGKSQGYIEGLDAAKEIVDETLEAVKEIGRKYQDGEQ